MKKNLLFLLGATATCLFAYAELPQTAEAIPATRPVSKVVKNAEQRTWKNIGEGTYSDAILCNLFRDLYNEPVKVTVEECEQTPGLYRVVNPWPGINTDEIYYLTIDATDPEMIFVPEHTAPITDPQWGETHFRSISDYAVNGLGLTKDQFLKGPLGNCNATLKDNVITMPSNFLGVMWPDCPAGGPSEPGVWTVSNGEYSGYLALPGAEMEDEWTSLGSGKMVEGFLWPIFEEAGAKPVEKDVEILESKSTPGLYKLVKPFAETSPNGRDLIIDATDPDFVRVPLQNTGVNSEYGYTYVISLSSCGYDSYEAMILEDESYAERNITLKDGVINMPRFSVLVHWPDASNEVFKHENVCDSYVKLPAPNAIETIGDSNADAPAEYFNLQGIRLSNPEKGQMVIVRQGNKATKQIMK